MEIDKIFIGCAVFLFVTYILFESFESFKRNVIYFLLVINKGYHFKRIFIERKESVNDYINSHRTSALAARIFANYHFSETKKLLREIEGFNNEIYRFANEKKYKESCDARELRDAHIAKLYIALGNPQL